MWWSNAPPKESLIRKKKALKCREFPDFTWCWSAIELQKYNTRSRSDTSDTSYLQKCSANVVCYFWSSCWTSYSSKKSVFYLYTPPSQSHIQFKYLTPPRQSSNARSSSINWSQTDKALPVKTSKPTFVTFFVYFGNSLFNYLWNFFVCYRSKSGNHFARNASLEELEVNECLVQDIPRLSSQSERAKNTIHCFI